MGFVIGVKDNEFPAFLIPICENGNLREFLERRERSRNPLLKKEKFRMVHLPISYLIQFSTRVSSSLKLSQDCTFVSIGALILERLSLIALSVHSKDVIHRDLKAVCNKFQYKSANNNLRICLRSTTFW